VILDLHATTRLGSAGPTGSAAPRFVLDQRPARGHPGSMDAITDVPLPGNEPVHDYAPNSAERTRLRAELSELAGNPIDLPHVVGGIHRMGVGARINVVQPHRHAARLGTLTNAEHDDAAAAIESALAAKQHWAAMPFDERAAIFLRAADLLAGPWREKIAAATMLGQSKTAYQAEIDAPCELIDFWRFNVAFARRILACQPLSVSGEWNRTDYRPLDGFVYAITPFNFSSIAGNLPTAPALMGNTVVWKPSITQTLAAYLIMQLLETAGLPPGVINLLAGDGYAVSDVALGDSRLAGIHFTGSTATFQRLWRAVGTNIERYLSYPRMVGETGGKDFVLAHASARPDVLCTALIRGAFDYQGQKCSAASRAFIARSVWRRMGDDFLAATAALRYGDITDLTNYGGALIDERAFTKNVNAIERAKSAAGATIAVGGHYDDSEGYFVRPTVILSDDPTDEAFSCEYFGPLLSVHVYPDDAYQRILDVIDTGSRYALTGAVIADDRDAVLAAQDRLRFAAGNFYVNDKPTGAVVGRQPFGGSRGSGTNDKAGSPLNLLRWTSARTIKETFVPATNHLYPHMGMR
jgi:1-pyrroline-5-carboxylate dehydrogenase